MQLKRQNTIHCLKKILSTFTYTQKNFYKLTKRKYQIRWEYKPNDANEQDWYTINTAQFKIIKDEKNYKSFSTTL